MRARPKFILSRIGNISALALVLLLGTLAFSQAHPLSGVSWHQLGFSPGHSGWNPSEQDLSPQTVHHLKKAWTLTTGGPINGGAAEAGGLIYFGTQIDNRLYAINSNNGSVVWSFPTDGYVLTSPAVENGIVYVSSSNINLADVYAVNARTGAMLWDYTITDTFGYLTDPVVAGGIVYVVTEAQSAPGVLYAIDARSGVVVWTRIIEDFVTYAPAVANGAVYVTGSDGHVSNGVLYAFDALSGASKGTLSIGGNIGAAIAANGAVFVATNNGSSDVLYSLDGRTGTTLWSFTRTNSLGWSFTTPATDGKRVYFSGPDSNVVKTYALDANTSSMVWSMTSNCCVSNAPTVANGVLYLQFDRRVIALNAASGARLWNSTLALAPILPSPTVVNGMLLYGSADSNFYAYRLP